MRLISLTTDWFLLFLFTLDGQWVDPIKIPLHNLGVFYLWYPLPLHFKFQSFWPTHNIYPSFFSCFDFFLSSYFTPGFCSILAEKFTGPLFANSQLNMKFIRVFNSNCILTEVFSEFFCSNCEAASQRKNCCNISWTSQR